MPNKQAGGKMISILIPTLNRSDFLIRALHYYSQVAFKGYLCIGDSSNAQQAEKIKQAIQHLQSKLRIIYRTFPNPPYIHGGMVMKELIKLVPTPYAVFAGDDDFVIPGGLEQGAAFLENHPEYSAVHGVRVAVRLQCSGAFGHSTSACYIREPILESETASERWVGYMRRGIATHYCVHRTETWRRMYRDNASVPVRYLGPELFPCSLSSILGKIKGLDCLSAVMQATNGRYFTHSMYSLYSLIVHPDWSRSVEVVRNCIVEALAQQDGIDVKEAQEIFDRELWRHILLVLQRQYHQGYGERTGSYTLEETLKRIPGLFALVRHLRQIAGKADPTHRYENLSSLDSLLKPSSPFYADFMPVYHAITEGAPEFP